MSLYSELLSKGKEAIAAIELPFKVKKEEKNLEMKILELEQQIAKDELTIQQQKSANPVNWDSLIDALDNKAYNAMKLEKLIGLKEELFGKN
jgi:hypothetical protein